jgi:hypothetical protein
MLRVRVSVDASLLSARSLSSGLAHTWVLLDPTVTTTFAALADEVRPVRTNPEESAVHAASAFDRLMRKRRGHAGGGAMWVGRQPQVAPLPGALGYGCLAGRVTTRTACRHRHPRVRKSVQQSRC